MQKYKLKQDLSALNKGTKHHIASIGSNQSLLKQLASHQNKSTLSVVINSTDVHHSKSLHQRNKSSKHLQSQTFTNNTHQNSVNIPAFSNSHNNSKSNKKLQNQKKKSTGKKLTSSNTQSKLLPETSYGRSSSQYQNLLIQPNSKNQPSKNYKNILKNRKQTKEQQPLNQHKEQAGLKSHKDLKHHQNHQKSINVSSFKDLKKKSSKSRSKSKQFQTMNKKLNQSKKHLIAEASNMTSQQNNMNQGNQRKSQGRKKADKATKPQAKPKGVIIFNGQGKECKGKKINELGSEDYERVPLCMLKSSTNSEIQFSNNDQNTVKSLIRQQKITNNAYFYDGQADDIVFCKDNYQYGQEEMMRKQESNKLSKKYSKMNLRLSSECLNCLTEPDYTIEPKGVRHRNPNMSGSEQEILSQKRTSQFSSKLQKSSQKKLISKFRNLKQTANSQAMHKSATIIQKVWRGYMTRKLLQKFIQEQEMRLFQRMRQIGQMKRQMMENVQSHQVGSERSERGGEDSDEEEIKIVEQECVEQSLGNVNESNNTAGHYSQHQITASSVTGLDYESEILARDDTLSFIVELNTNMGSKPQPSSKKPPYQSLDEVLYTEVQSIDHLSKVVDVCQEGEYSIVGGKHEQMNGDFNGANSVVGDEQQYICEQSEADECESQKETNPLLSEQENLKKFTFFDNHQAIANDNDISRSYEESSYTQPSSIFFRPVQHSRDISSIHKISFSKDHSDSYIINDQQQSYRIQESMEEERQNHCGVTGKSLNHEESSYCLGDESEGHGQNISDPTKERGSNLYENLFEKSKEITQYIEESYKIDDESSIIEKQQPSNIVPEKTISENVNLQKQISTQPLVIQSIVANKSNPNILLIKSPKHQSLSKSYFSPSKSHKKDNQKEAKQDIKKISSLKEFFFKKSLLGNQTLNEKQEIQLPILSFSSHQLNLLSFPAQKEASSIESLLHFRHQCLTHQHSKQFRQIQELYVKQKISKQDFILRLHQLASHFQESAVSIKQAQKDIFNGYKALLKLIKDVLKDCKMLGLSQEKGSNVRFCRSMEIFFREKDKMSNQKCVFDDEYLWRFDDVMIDELQKIKLRVFQNSKSQKSEKKSQCLESGQVGGGELEEQRGSITSQFSVCKEEKKETVQKDQASNKKPVLEEKQLSRQSLSHKQLPQLILDNKGEKETSSLTAPRKLSPQKVDYHFSKQKEPFQQPCSFDISELGECEDDYFDDDEPSASESVLNKNAQGENHKTMKQNNVSPGVQDLNGSDSYDIDEDSLDGKIRHQEQNISLNQQSPETDHIAVTLPSPNEKDHINMNKPTAQTQQQIDIRTTQLKLIPDIHLVINNKNREFLQRGNDDQNLLDSDDAEVLPVIKRQVYQLSCDSDEEEGAFVDKWETEEETHQIHFFSKEKKVDASSVSFNRSMSFSLYDKKVPQEESPFSKKYSPLGEFVQQIVIWEFIQEIVINKNKLQSKNGFGKKISEFAKKNFYSIQDENLVNFNKNDTFFEQSNIIIINNDQNLKKNKKTNNQTQKSTQSSRESLSKINNQEINSFLQILYQQFPTFEENKSKLVQRMYPSPIQLLISLRDSSMQDYFDVSRRKHKHTSDGNWENEQNNQNEDHEFGEKSYTDHSNMDSETSYLELGSYEFLLSQQLCQLLIEKYISEVYDIEMQIKLKAEKEGNGRIQAIKKEFNEYLELKGVMTSGSLLSKNEGNVLSPSKMPKQGSFQSIIRTRELFLQHKEIQSLMLRKQILKIELHTLLDAMNEQLIKQRESKIGYSGIGLSELALGTIQRTGIEVKTQQDYAILTTKAKYRLQKFVLNQEVNLNDKLLLECQESVTINDSQWIFYVTEALQFGLQIAKIVQELLWEEAVREISKMQLKRMFKLDDCSALEQRVKTVKEESGDGRPMMKGKKVISINIVDSSQKEYSPIKDQEGSSIKQFNPRPQSEDTQLQNHSEGFFQKNPEKSEQEQEITHLPFQKQFDKISQPYNFDFDESGIMMPKINDESKSFDDSHVENQETNFCQTSASKMQIEALNDNRQQSAEDDDSYKLDEDSMQFDEELDKELDEMNDD